ncbi:MAG: DUF2292 domain-containing protein [Patescibacteria group bacterium]
MDGNSYSTQSVSPLLLEELKRAVESVPDYGSVEVYIQKGRVTQISTRHIRKTEVVGSANGKSA